MPGINQWLVSKTCKLTSLLTISSVQQNSNMIWDGATTVHNNWGNSPTQIYPLNIRLSLNIQADSIKIFPLDVSGNENQLKYYSYKSSNNLFDFSFNQNIDKSLWYFIETFGNGNPAGVEENSPNQIKEFHLDQNYPNPFNPATVINYQMPVSSNVTLKIYDILGNEVATLVDEFQSAGVHSVTFNAMKIISGKKLSSGNFASGIYFYTIRAGSFVQTKKMILLK